MIRLTDDGVLELKGTHQQLLVEFGVIAAGLVHGNDFEIIEILSVIAAISTQTKEDFKNVTEEVKE